MHDFVQLTRTHFIVGNWKKVMDTVNFLTIDIGDDLTLSFCREEGTKYGIDGFGIFRSPKYYLTLERYERGQYIEWNDNDAIIRVREFFIRSEHL